MVWTWWDNGYPVQYWARRATVADGQHHGELQRGALARRSRPRSAASDVRRDLALNPLVLVPRHVPLVVVPDQSVPFLSGTLPEPLAGPLRPIQDLLDLAASVGVGAGEGHRNAAQPGLLAGLNVQDLALEPMPLGPPNVHAEQHLGPVGGVGPAGAGVDGDDGVGGVVLSSHLGGQLDTIEER